jgi:hypothetical protein
MSSIKGKADFDIPAPPAFQLAPLRATVVEIRQVTDLRPYPDLVKQRSPSRVFLISERLVW